MKRPLNVQVSKILRDHQFNLTAKEAHFLRCVRKYADLTDKQQQYANQIIQRYQQFKERTKYPKPYQKLTVKEKKAKYSAKHQKTLAIAAKIGETEAKTEP